MIIKSLELENIRSYEKELIKIPLGTTLFEGDIGSGKSSILLAIEFALFGLGNQKGASLLRTGAKEGSVKLTFEIDGMEYEVGRSLVRKGRRVHQAEGYIKYEEGVKHLSATELKEEILEILNFNEPPNPRAQSVIYRYAVYTPQEEMKAILWARPDSRLQTLRKAFRIEDYRIAVENALGLARTVSKKVNFLEGQISDLDEKKRGLQDKKKTVKKNEKMLKGLQKEEEKLKTELKQNKKELEELLESEKKLKKAEGQIPLLQDQIEEKNKQVEKLVTELDELNQEIASELHPEIDKLKQVKRPTTKELDTLNEELNKLREKEKKLRKVETAIETKIEDYRSVEKNKICPTCDRPADPKEFEEKIKLKILEKEKASKDVNECQNKVKETEMLIEKLREYDRAQEKIRELEKKIQETRKRIAKNDKEIKKLKRSREKLQANLNQAKQELKKLAKVAERISKLNKLVEKGQQKVENIGKKIAFINALIGKLNEDVNDLTKEIQKKEDQKKLAAKLEEYQFWLKDYFVPTLANIEKHVMITINQEFNQQFQRWFSLLVEDPGKDARVDEDFTPIVEQDGYEQLVDFLSGGEKTSIALAYRLALNNIVQKVSVGMKSNLLILDEPTDGFSKEQLFKVRDILGELRCPQVIMVSHERELESFADKIFQVTKTGGISKITSVF